MIEWPLFQALHYYATTAAKNLTEMKQQSYQATYYQKTWGFVMLSGVSQWHEMG